MPGMYNRCVGLCDRYGWMHDRCGWIHAMYVRQMCRFVTGMDGCMTGDVRQVWVDACQVCMTDV